MRTGDILIAAAVDGEMAGIRECLTDATVRTIGRQTVTTGRIGSRAVRLVVTGPGIANTVHGLTAAITVEIPGLILQIGCGGGFSEAGVEVGEVAVATTEIDVHLGLETEDPASSVDKLPFPIIRKGNQEIFNAYPVDAMESDCAFRELKRSLADSNMNVHKGPFVTVATVTASFTRAGYLYRSHGALLENMEGAGAAHVAALYDIPFLEIRAVSNRVGDRDKSRWDLPLAFGNCTRAVKVVLENTTA